MPSNVDWEINLLEDSSVKYPFLYHHKGEGLVTTTENLEIRDAMTLVRIHGKPTSFITLTDMSLVVKGKDCDDVIKAEVSESIPKMNMAEEECMGTLLTQNSNQSLYVILLQEHKLWKDDYIHVCWGYLRAVSTICRQIQSMPGGCGRTALYLLLSHHTGLTRLMGSATNYRWRVVPPYYKRDEEQGMGGSCQHIHAVIQYE